MKRFPFAHENLAPPGKPNRGPLFVGRELDALANNVVGLGQPVRILERRPDKRRRRPKAIANTEAIGHKLGPLEHYGEPIRSRKNPGRANLALYLRNGLEGPPPQWVDHKETWPRTEHDGTHPARSSLIKELHHGPAVVVGHGPPIGPGTADARAEWVEVTAGILWQYGQVIWLGDPNGLLDEVLLRLGDPKAARGGDGTDAVLVRGFALEDARTVASVNGVPMLTDHRKALLGRAVRRG